jgi:hypothetical protein
VGAVALDERGLRRGHYTSTRSGSQYAAVRYPRVTTRFTAFAPAGSAIRGWSSVGFAPSGSATRRRVGRQMVRQAVAVFGRCCTVSVLCVPGSLPSGLTLQGDCPWAWLVRSGGHVRWPPRLPGPIAGGSLSPSAVLGRPERLIPSNPVARIAAQISPALFETRCRRRKADGVFVQAARSRVRTRAGNRPVDCLAERSPGLSWQLRRFG